MHTICTTPGLPRENLQSRQPGICHHRGLQEIPVPGEAIARGGDDRPNKNIYTGSVIKKGENEYYAFYTAYNADIRIHGKSVQSVMRASSQDLIHWETDEDSCSWQMIVCMKHLTGAIPSYLKMRKRDNYWMLLAAGKREAEP